MRKRRLVVLAALLVRAFGVRLAGADAVAPAPTPVRSDPGSWSWLF